MVAKFENFFPFNIEESVESNKVKTETEELKAVNENYVNEVFVSHITDPSLFYVQKVGVSSITLDKLVQDMTAYYEQENNRVHLLKKVSTDIFFNTVTKNST